MTYKYSGVPLTSAVAVDLIHEIAPAAPIGRPELVAQVQRLHEERGGLPARGALTPVIKRALKVMSDNGEIEAVSYGFWRYSGHSDPGRIDEPIVVGEGSEIVYTYYFPAYRDQAAHLGRAEWPMKIGRTIGDLSIRLQDQGATAMPESPVVGLQYRTDNSANAERLLHSMLIERGRKIDGSPGKEWFMTSISEVKSILDFATGQ